MKFLFYLFVLCIIFSFGMYIGMDRTESTIIVDSSDRSNVEQSEESSSDAEEKKVDRDEIIEEMNNSNQHQSDQVLQEKAPDPPIFLKVASMGEKLVENVFDRLLSIGYSIINELF
ncbi:hypothetical protein J416_05918 [Gracilibacillus halophilus YIM-C55.5]|uniref:Uncharacterized protein n=1 Tax=Gracilibacillus halophilus YIM-C55.5 TaxID=1308866 RepID=N4WE60_9BACI|nr:hypothetical protein [Gracilibacillus halophilus]ENH97524.1 hypothetical protein J416_05918 [Gracilibacillus halophilus YIM-C55.5]